MDEITFKIVPREMLVNVLYNVFLLDPITANKVQDIFLKCGDTELNAYYSFIRECQVKRR